MNGWSAKQKMGAVQASSLFMGSCGHRLCPLPPRLWSPDPVIFCSRYRPLHGPQGQDLLDIPFKGSLLSAEPGAVLVLSQPFHIIE